ncbi:MAG TPA: hypothetical protein VGL29_18260 [Blastocatellia bacterium]
MARGCLIITQLVLLASLTATVQLAAHESSADIQIESSSNKESLTGSVRLVETKQESEKVFQHDIVSRGVFAVILTLANQSKDSGYSLQRSNITVRTEFDAQIASLEPQRAYDRLMWKIGSGPAFAEAGIVRAIAEGSRKKKLQKSVLAAAIGANVTLTPGDEIEGALFFVPPKDTKTLRFSTLVVGEIINQKSGERFPLRFPLATQQ